MEPTTLQVMVGAGLAVVAALIFRTFGPRRERRLWAVALVVAALIYVGFAAAGGGARWLPMELLGVVIYGLVAGLGLRFSPWWLALGWAAHVAWDVTLHGGGGTPFVPGWYPGLCIGFDLLAAGWIALRCPGWVRGEG